MVRLWLRRVWRGLDPRRSLAAQLTAAIFMVGIVAAVVSVLIGARSIAGYLHERVGEEIAEDAWSLAVDLDMGMFERYRDVHALAALPVFADGSVASGVKRDLLEDLQDGYPLYAWIGLADTGGRVVASTGGLLEGQSVAERPWFEGGLGGTFVGDVHEAVLLEAKLSSPDSGERPLRFVDVAAAVYGPSGEVVGVLGAHLYWEWAEQLRATVLRGADDGNRAAFILDSNGDVLLGSEGDMQLAGAARVDSGDSGFFMARNGGIDHLVGVAATQGYLGYPGLGWRVVIQERAEAALAPIRAQQRAIFWAAVLGVLVFALVAGGVLRYLLRPVVAITRAAYGARRSSRDARIPVYAGKDEIARLSRALHHFVEDLTARNEELARSNEELLAANVKIQHDALHHGLTGLPNRALLLDRIARSLRRRSRNRGYDFAMAHLDVDRFKSVNQAFGRQVGDEVLVEVARRLQAAVEPLDTVAHIAADEFAVLFDNVGSAETQSRLRAIQEALGRPFDLPGVQARITLSVGLVPAALEHASAEGVLRDGDLAVQVAKATGRGSIHVADETLRKARSATFDVENGLRRALAHEQLEVHYQPIVELAVERTVGFEALVRWRDPQAGLIAPGEFIPVAEESGLIIELDRWVLREACRQLRHLEDLGEIPGGLTLNVNLSPQQFTQEDLAHVVEGILIETGFPPERLKLEITEGLVMERSELSRQLTDDLVALGVRLAIDDFGMGYSSLSYLQRFPASTIKIDRFFINTVHEAPETQALVGTIVSLAANLGMDVVAEGIETREQARALQKLGCDRGQGYFFGRPLQRAQLSEQLAFARE